MAVLGPSWSSLSVPAVQIGGGVHLPFVSGAAESPSLATYLYSFRVAGQMDALLKTLNLAMEHFSWLRFSVLAANDAYYGQAGAMLLLDWAQHTRNAACMSTTFLAPDAPAIEYEKALLLSREQGAAIRVLHLFGNQVTTTATTAHRLGLFGVDYAWCGTSETFDPTLMATDSAVREAMQAIHIAVASTMLTHTGINAAAAC